MRHPIPSFAALVLALLLGGAAEAHGNAPSVVIRTPGFGFSYGAPTVHRYGYHYAPRWNYAPAPYSYWRGPGYRAYGYAAPHRHHRHHRRHFDRHDRRRGRDHHRD